MYQNETSTKNNETRGDKASVWESRYTSAAGDQTSLFDKFNEWYKMMYAIRDTRNIAAWRSKVHVPILSTKAWNMVAKFVQQEPGFEVEVRNEDAEDLPIEELQGIAEKVQRKLEHDYHNPEMTETMRDKLNACLVDAVVTGTGLAKVPWVTKKKKSYRHATKKSGGEEVLDYDQDAVTSFAIGYNDLEPVNIFNVFIAPSATSLQTAPWVIISERKTLAQLKEVNDSYGVDVYKNLDKLRGVKSTADRFAEQKKARQNLTSEQDPYIADQTVDEIEIFECYERDTGTICTYASLGVDKSDKISGWVVIREQKNPYWHGKFPLVPFYIRRRPFHFWGESLFQTTDRLQAAANDVFNHYLDNWSLSVDGGIMIDEQSQVNDFLVEPGFELVYRGEQPKQFSFPTPDPNQLTIVMNQIEKSVENATISNYATGTPVSGLDKTQGTARGTMAILEAATDMIQFMRDNFSSSIRQVGEMWLSNNRQFMDFDFPTPTLKDNKMEMEVLTPEEMQLQMELRINDMAMQPISDQQKRENFVAYQDRLIQLQTASVSQSQITGDQSQVLFLDFNVQAQELAKHFNQRGIQKQVLPNDQALAVQNEQAMAEEAAVAEEGEMAALEQENADQVDDDVMQIAELPDEEVVDRAEEMLNELEAASGR